MLLLFNTMTKYYNRKQINHLCEGVAHDDSVCDKMDLLCHFILL